MRMMLPLAFATVISTAAVYSDDQPPLVEKYLLEGRLAEGENALKAAVATDPKNGQARFGLGTIQFVRAVERLYQGLYRFGGTHVMGTGPIVGSPLGLPLPGNPNPQLVRDGDLRALLQQWIDGLAQAEATLAKIDDPAVKLPLHFGSIRLDFNGDGKADDNEVLWKIYGQLNARAGQMTAESAKQFVIAFDRGDVAWLRVLPLAAGAQRGVDGLRRQGTVRPMRSHHFPQNRFALCISSRTP